MLPDITPIEPAIRQHHVQHAVEQRHIGAGQNAPDADRPALAVSVKRGSTTMSRSAGLRAFASSRRRNNIGCANAVFEPAMNMHSAWSMSIRRTAHGLLEDHQPGVLGRGDPDPDPRHGLPPRPPDGAGHPAQSVAGLKPMGRHLLRAVGRDMAAVEVLVAVHDLHGPGLPDPLPGQAWRRLALLPRQLPRHRRRRSGEHAPPVARRGRLHVRLHRPVTLATEGAVGEAGCSRTARATRR